MGQEMGVRDCASSYEGLVPEAEIWEVVLSHPGHPRAVLISMAY